MGLFRRQPTNPHTEFDKALRTETSTDKLAASDTEDMYRNWVALHAECDVSARDFVRVLIGKPTRIEPSILDAAARKISAARGTASPEGRWVTNQVDAHHERLVRAIVDGASGDEVQVILGQMPAFWTNTAKLILALVEDAVRISEGMGDLLTKSAQAGDPVVSEAYRLIHLAQAGNWDEVARVVQDACANDGISNETGELGQAIEGFLVGLLYRERSANQAY